MNLEQYSDESQLTMSSLLYVAKRLEYTAQCVDYSPTQSVYALPRLRAVVINWGTGVITIDCLKTNRILHTFDFSYAPYVDRLSTIPKLVHKCLDVISVQLDYA